MNESSPYSIGGKCILVTGASSGIGASVAVECSKLGARLVITGRNEKRLDETFEKLTGENHIKIIADLSNPRKLEEIIVSIPCIQGVVHCAGLTQIVPFQFAKRELINEVFNVNFFAPIELTRLLVKSKKIVKESSVVFISSISGIYCSAVATSIYSASKGAVNGMAKGMAIDLASRGIRVNTVTPGVIETDFFKESEITQHDLKEGMKRYPLGRYGKPEEVAFAVIYLLSDASKWVTGSNLLIDGGYTLL